MSTIDRRSTWHKSTFSGNTGGECVEINNASDPVLVRDSKFRRDPANRGKRQPTIAIPAADWQTLLDLAIASTSGAVGEAMLLEVHDDGSATFTAAETVLSFTPQEWDAFGKGVAADEFRLR